MWKIIVIYLLVYCVYGTVWGVVVNKVIENKGYRENWFWWGFFFGFLALIVALTKPNIPRTTSDTGSYFNDTSSVVGKDYVFRGFGYEGRVDQVPGGWRCQHCGKINAGYVGTCGCGCDKSGNMPIKSPEQTQQAESQTLYCVSCGKPLETGAKFCRFCGTKANI